MPRRLQPYSGPAVVVGEKQTVVFGCKKHTLDNDNPRVTRNKLLTIAEVFFGVLVPDDPAGVVDRGRGVEHDCLGDIGVDDANLKREGHLQQTEK